MTTRLSSSSLRPPWVRTAGILIATGGVLLTAATALEVWTDVATAATAATAFWILFLASTLAHVVAMVALALGRGDGAGAVGASLVGKVALLGFGATFLANQSMYLLVAYLLPDAEVGAGGAEVFLFAMSAVQGILLLVGGAMIAAVGVLQGAARWAILVLALVGIALGITINASDSQAVLATAYFVSTIAQIIAGLVIARARVRVATK